MGYLIDSNVLIDFERQRIDLNREIAGRDQEEFFPSVISISQLLHGVHRANTPAVQARRSATDFPSYPSLWP